MKIFVFVMLIASLVGPASTAIAENPELVSVPLTKAYVPIGFDDNDNIQVVVAGILPNLCYKVGRTEFLPPNANGAIAFKQQAYRYKGFCLPVAAPFFAVVDLGILKPTAEKGPGYVLLDSSDPTGKTTLLGHLPVEVAKTESADEFPYAPVDDAQIEAKDDSGYVLKLRGVYPNRCMKIVAEPIVRYFQGIIVVQPVVAIDEGPCRPAPERFQRVVPLKPGLKGAHLIHIRTMNGQSINKVFDFSIDNYGDGLLGFSGQ